MINYKKFMAKLEFLSQRIGSWVMDYSERNQLPYPNVCYMSIDIASNLRKLGFRTRAVGTTGSDFQHYYCIINYGGRQYALDVTSIQFQGNYNIKNIPDYWKSAPYSLDWFPKNAKLYITELGRHGFHTPAGDVRGERDFFLDSVSRKKMYLYLRRELKRYERS